MATNTIGSSTLAHRIHTNVNTDNLSSNKEYMDNQEDAILSYMEETKGEKKGYKPIIITHIEREEGKVIITRLDNGSGMDNVDVFIDASKSTTKKEKIGHFHQGMFNSTFSLKADTDIIVSRGSQLKANSLKLYPKKMVEKVEEGLKNNKLFNSLDTYLTDYLIEKKCDGEDIPMDKRIKWDELLTKSGSIINEQILKIKNGSRGTIQQQIWEENCPITQKSMEKYNNSLKYKRKEFTPTYIFNNNKFEIKTKCYVPKKYNVLKFPIKIKYNGNKGKLYIKATDNELLFCNKSDTSLISINKEDEDIKFDDKITIKLALISVEDAKIQQKDLQLSAIYDLKVPVIETKRCILGISRTIFDKRLMTHHLFKTSGQLNPRLSFCIEDNDKYKKFGVTSNKDIPNLENPEDKMVKKLLLNFVEPLYKYLIKKYAHGKWDLKDKRFGENGITNKNDWNLDEIVDFITSSKKKPQKPVPKPVPQPSLPKRENISTLRKENLWIGQFDDKFKVRCICEKFMTPFTSHMGHIIAHSEGGCCTDDNLYWICKKCNGNDTTPIYEMIEKNYGKEHIIYKKLINDFKKLGKKYE